MTRDPFKGVSAEIAARNEGASDSAPPSRAAGGDWVAPVPGDAPHHPDSHRNHGKPATAWPYRNGAGQLLQWICRFDKPDGGKEVLPLTLWREEGRLRWRWKAALVPRPLYRLDALAASPAAPVLVVEGEKTADAAVALFPSFVVVCWSGGSKAVKKSDWSPLQGRRVLILPDADPAGADAAEMVAAMARNSGAEGVAIVALPAALPIGWDVADDWPVAFDRAALSDLIGEALALASRGEVQLPYGYRLETDGLFHKEHGRDGAHDVRLSDGFTVLGEARDSEGGGWSVLIRFRDRDGRRKVQIIARSRLAAEASAVRSELAGDGLFIHPGRGKSERFAAFLAEVGHSRRITLAERTGWVDDRRFALPAEVIAGATGEAVHFTGSAAALHYRQAGTIEGWQETIASRAIGNRLLVFAISLAFAGPMMRSLGLEGGGFHFRGASSSGKTSLAMAAGSVWGGGGPLGFGASWRATGNALEGVAFGHSETLLILDELALVDPAEAGAAAYALATGQGKARARQDGSLRRRSEWRVLVLSTGEIGLADHMRAARRAERTMAGQELRLIDLAADAGCGMGAFEQLHGSAGPAQFSDGLKSATGQHYGQAGPLFVKRLIAESEGAGVRARMHVAAFMAAAKRDGDSGQVHRGASRFAAVAAAGEMAIALGVLPWPAGTAKAAALAMFNQWADGFGRSGLLEERQIIIAVRNAIEQNASRFAAIRETARDEDDWAQPSARTGEARSLQTLGFLHAIDFQQVYLIHDAGWAEILKGFDLKFAVKVLITAGLMVPGEGKHLKRKVRVGEQLRRFYTVRASILEYDEEDRAAGPD